MRYSFKSLFYLLGGSVALSACSLFGGGGSKPTAQNPGQLSNVTRLAFNDEDAGGFMVKPFKGQPDAPSRVFMEARGAVMGSFERGVMSSRDTLARTVSAAAFYMDETEIASINWLECLPYLASDWSQEGCQAALPDATVSVGKLAF